MTKPDYRKALKTAEQHLVKLYRQREINELDIVRTRETVLTLRMQVEGDAAKGVVPAYPENLTAACEWVLLGAKKPLDPPTIRDRIEALGFDMKSSNPLASVHSVLNRMVERGDVKMACQKLPDGGIVFLPRCYWSGRFYELPEGWELVTWDEYRRLVGEHLPHLAVKRRARPRKGVGGERKK